MRRKRLLIDVNSILGYVKTGYVYGVGRSTFELLSALNKLIESIPFDIVLFSQNMKGISPKGFLRFRSCHFFWPNRECYNKFLYFLGLKKGIIRYDLMHVPHNVDDVLDDVPNTIFTIHDVIVLRYPQYWNLTEEKKKQLQNVAQQCKAIVTCSECSKRDIVQSLNVPESKVTSIPWGINREMFQSMYDEDYLHRIGIHGLYYFTSSANHPRKNLPLLLKSYRTYLAMGGQSQLVILNPEEEHLDSVADLITDRKIVIQRKITDKELAVLYTNAQCSLLLSSYEGFGLPVLESLACKTQVICARNSSLVEAGGDVVDYIDDMDESVIAGKILEYDERVKETILDPIILEEHLNKFSWEECARKYIEFYKQQLSIS